MARTKHHPAQGRGDGLRPPRSRSGCSPASGRSPGGASSHREAPFISNDPQADSTDLYAFVSPDDPNKTTIISNWIPFEEPAGGPNFYPFGEGRPLRHPDRQRRGRRRRPHLPVGFTNHYRNPDTFLYNTGQVTSLDDEDLNFSQTYDLHRINVDTGRTKLVADDVPAVPSYVGLRVDAGLRGPLRGGRLPGRRSQLLGRPGRRPVLPRPAGLQPPLRTATSPRWATTRWRGST